MGGGCSLLTELCGIVRGTGSGVRQATCKFLQEKLDKVRPATAEEKKEILSSTHAELHMGENYEIFSKTKWGGGEVCSRDKTGFVEVGKGGFFGLGILHSCHSDGAEQSHHLKAQELSVFSDVWEEDE